LACCLSSPGAARNVARFLRAPARRPTKRIAAPLAPRLPAACPVPPSQTETSPTMANLPAAALCRRPAARLSKHSVFRILQIAGPVAQPTAALQEGADVPGHAGDAARVP